MEKEKNKSIKEGDIVTIKRRGKFVFERIMGENRKGKIRVVVKKFI